MKNEGFECGSRHKKTSHIDVVFGFLPFYYQTSSFFLYEGDNDQKESIIFEQCASVVSCTSTFLCMRQILPNLGISVIPLKQL